MGEEIGAQKPYRCNDFLDNRENILGEADGGGAGMISCYRGETIRAAAGALKIVLPASGV